MGKGGGGISPQVQQGMLSNESALVNIAQQQAGNAMNLYGLTEPGLQSAEDLYQTLAGGDPGAIARATAPSTQQVTSAAEGAKKNILMNSPAGGEKNLALESVNVNKGAQIGALTSGAAANAPNALASLAGQGIGESISSAQTGISGLSAGSQTLGSLGGLQLEGQQIQAENFGTSLGFFGGLIQDLLS